MASLACHICGQPIDEPERTLHRGVFGWERPNHGVHGLSGSSLELRERTGDVAHGKCIALRKSGMSVEAIRGGIEQGSLL